jgi:hypothetical protein
VLGGDFGTAAKYFERNLRLSFTPSLVAAFGPSETMLCEVLYCLHLTQVCLTVGYRRTDDRTVEKGGHGQGIYGRAKPSGDAIIYSTKLMIRLDIFMPGGPHALAI